MYLVSFEATIFVTAHKSIASIFSVISERLIEVHNFQMYLFRLAAQKFP